jgi:asparagine synthase (glutamine-hydrolysing)
MLASQVHRGPDDEGVWAETVCGAQVGLGVSRLSIIDLSAAGHQPMVSACGRYVLAFNGEVYNYVELREELRAAGCQFRSHSDTEVVLEALRAWGPDALARFNGMWGLAFFDRERGSLLLARDRFGVKPLYMYRTATAFYFASEIKSILVGSGDRFEVNAAVAARYLKDLRLEAGNDTFFAGIEKVPAGHYTIVRIGPTGAMPEEPRPFWELQIQELGAKSLCDQVEYTRQLLTDAVRLRLRSDVPVGVLLSGGLDSSALAALMQRVNGRDSDLHLFSAVSRDARFSEEPYIDIMADHLGRPVEKVWLDHSPERVMELIEETTWFNDEPLGTLVSLAQYQIMQRAKELGVTVMLSGQGADELFFGYQGTAIFYLEQLLRRGKILKASRLLLDFAREGTVLSDYGIAGVRRFLSRRRPLQGTGYLGSMLLPVVTPPLPRARDPYGMTKSSLYRTSLPAIVHAEDRMSMACSREVRNPYLDFRIAELAYSMPADLKIRDGWTKWILRKAVEPLLPPAITWRKDKQGFINPQPRWLQHDLRPSIEAMVDGPMLSANAGIVDQSLLRRHYAERFARTGRFGRLSWQDGLYPLAFEVWMRRFEQFLRW